MFGKLKEKLKGWFKKAGEKAEEQAEKVVETKIEAELEEKKEEEVEKEIKKAEKEEKPEEKIKEGIKQIEEKAEKKAEKDKKSLFGKIRDKFKFKITEDYFEELFTELEISLLENNVALEVIEKIKKDLKQELLGLEMGKDNVEEKIKEALKISLETLFIEPFDLIKKIKNKKGIFVIVFFGINGSGKTTTIAKISHLLQKNNISSVLAASDTFRAASIEQLEKHAEKLGVKTIKSKYGADPASVAFDAVKHAEAKGIKTVLVDTAGRMYTKSDLMREMEKICRVANPDLKIFVAEAITGNDAVEQARKFNEAIGIDGIILTKADVDEKGGASISVSHVISKPILYLGVGQGMDDLKKFNKDKIIKNLGL